MQTAMHACKSRLLGRDSTADMHVAADTHGCKSSLCLMDQVDKMIGKGAPADFIENLEELAKTHHADMALDNIRAYYFGQRFIVEMEVVLPSAMTVRESHDIALILQHKVGSCCGLETRLSSFAATDSLSLVAAIRSVLLPTSSRPLVLTDVVR